MTPTFDVQSYTELLVSYQPKPITTEGDRAIALAQELEHRSSRTLEEGMLLTLIEKFEAANHPIPVGTPISMLPHWLDARDLATSDLIEILGSKEQVTEILAGSRPIRIDEASQLAQIFHIEAELFLA
jgi:HTH-type transcriptional regulator / antitoxin HigA